MTRVIGVDIGGTFTDLMLFDAEAENLQRRIRQQFQAFLKFWTIRCRRMHLSKLINLLFQGGL